MNQSLCIDLSDCNDVIESAHAFGNGRYMEICEILAGNSDCFFAEGSGNASEHVMEDDLEMVDVSDTHCV